MHWSTEECWGQNRLSVCRKWCSRQSKGVSSIGMYDIRARLIGVPDLVLGPEAMIFDLISLFVLIFSANSVHGC
jgi:hypothetical protein